MGSRSKIDLAYIAGFLDGDGSLMLQIKKRKDGKIGIRFMPTICFYQDSRHDKGLYWIQNSIGAGYLSKRKDGMTELRINGYKQVFSILEKIDKFIKFKKKQSLALLKACKILSNNKFQSLSKRQLNTLIMLILIIQNENYSTKNKKTKKDLLKILGLTP